VRLASFTELVGTALADAQARVELRGYGEEQAALRRVATQVAGGMAPEDVFATVAAEVGQMLDADVTSLHATIPTTRRQSSATGSAPVPLPRTRWAYGPGWAGGT
jgi:hypothetical protein